MHAFLDKTIRVATARGRFFQGRVLSENDEEIEILDEKSGQKVFVARRIIDELVIIAEPVKEAPAPDRDSRDEIFYKGDR